MMLSIYLSIQDIELAIAALKDEQAKIANNPCIMMREETRKLRQSSFKERYKQKHIISRPKA